MTTQDPQHSLFAPGMFVRGGQDKTVSEVDLSPARGEASDVPTDRVLRVDLDPQRSAEHWTPVLIDTPAFGDLPEATSGDSLPPLPGPMFPNAG
ncbi:hypothetical protein [Streptomyces noursei]|uniref:hypothetical protein n=1 Tax=Streptomyces noursei TaxID=1971 RepID=UPI001673B280|nr:hypothetical protein [Streptomyces noursei]MCZ1021100.1 hypothetical protein [Streptomyces noursei]MCZ1021131.1 hypothetical protein [Streptomyces noursei]MCZ1021474.1 hypothetical protein [Streptomyces noursei]GGX51510.1 hypothetical protein GCM10010341_86270 [Streptomyces noursei]